MFDFDWTDPADWVLALVSLAGIALVGLMVKAAIDDHNAPTFELRKDEWACTATTTETYTYFIMVGKVMVPQTGVDTVCVNYRRR